ncbi:MAG: DegT/DnrJ/EryC1/StrS family aminotransferase [Ancrocorticia sp.]|uniref:DegT/DnrJ/EryC1/StrS family aminotransferase n=1 Tax=Ancrocorticia sp. TaxID=2593684 RepID=UPI003F8E6CEB
MRGNPAAAADRVFLSAPDVGALEEEYVMRAMHSGWIAPLGPEVDAFEAEMAARLGVHHAVALSSGTAALHLGLIALGVGRGDVVVVANMTFAATANAVAYTGAEPYFVDCLPETGNMDPVLLEEALSDLRAHGRHAAAVIPVDLLGKAADYTAIGRVAGAYGVPILADAAESLGASHNGVPAGSFGEAAILSFNGNKVMTTSGGGMLVTNRGDIADRARYLATQAREPVVHYEHRDIGYNYRLSNLLAALGRAQLTRLDAMIDRRKEMRLMYKLLFSGVPGVTVFGAEHDDEDNYWLTSILVDGERAQWRASDLSHALSSENIESRPLWKPMSEQPIFRGAAGTINGSSQWLFAHGLALPSGSNLSEGQIRRIALTIREFLAHVTDESPARRRKGGTDS